MIKALFFKFTFALPNKFTCLALSLILSVNFTLSYSLSHFDIVSLLCMMNDLYMGILGFPFVSINFSIRSSVCAISNISVNHFFSKIDLRLQCSYLLQVQLKRRSMKRLKFFYWSSFDIMID